MNIVSHQNFVKNYKKRILPYKNLDRKFETRLKLFIQNPKNPELKDHKLMGSLEGLRAFSITGDVRVVYRIYKDSIELYDIGTHNQIY